MKQVNRTTQKAPATQKESTMHKDNTTQKVLIKPKQQGFTLIELALVLIIMAVIASWTTKAYLFQKTFERAETKADKTIDEINQINHAMGAYRLDNGTWADVAHDCAGAIGLLTNPPPIPPTPANPNPTNPTAYLRYIDSISPYGVSAMYLTSCDDNNFYVAVKSTKDWAKYIKTHLANTIIKPQPDDDTTITSTPRETINPTLADFLPFEGTTSKGLVREMLGDIDMGHNAISNASEIKTSEIALSGQDIKLGMGKFVSMGGVAIKQTGLVSNALGAVVKSTLVDKPNCHQGAIMGTPKIILRIHGIKTQLSTSDIRDVAWFAKFNSKNTTQWQLSTTGLAAITGVAETFCDYGTWNR